MSSRAPFLPSFRRAAQLWSVEELRRLRTLAALGTPVHSIAAALRRSPSAVRNKAAMHGISLQKAAQRRIARCDTETQSS